MVSTKYLRTQLRARKLNPKEYSHEKALTCWNSSRISTPLLNLSNLLTRLDLEELVSPNCYIQMNQNLNNQRGHNPDYVENMKHRAVECCLGGALGVIIYAEVEQGAWNHRVSDSRLHLVCTVGSNRLKIDGGILCLASKEASEEDSRRRQPSGKLGRRPAPGFLLHDSCSFGCLLDAS